MKIFLVGPPCSGKTVTARDLADRYDLLHLSSGDVARELARDDPKVEVALARGEYIDPTMMDRLMLRRLLATPEPQVIDGYPRYFEQLTDILANFVRHCEISFVIVECPDEEIRRRHDERGVTDVGNVEDRLLRYRERTEPMVRWIEGHYRAIQVSTYDNSREDVVRIIKDGINRMNGFSNGIPLRKV